MNLAERQILSIDWNTIIGVFMQIDWNAVLAITTIIIAIIALFQDKIHNWFYHPTLKVTMTLSPPDCLIVPSKDDKGVTISDVYYFRLRVENTGNIKAESVEVYANELREYKYGKFEIIQTFLPMNLKWSYTGNIFFLLNPKMKKHCDIFHVYDPEKRPQIRNENISFENVDSKKTILSIDTFVKSNSYSHLYPFGKYELDIVISASNAKSVPRTLIIDLKNGEWDSNEEIMFRDNIEIQLKNKK